MTDDISKVDYDELHVTHSAGEIAEMLRQSDAQCATLARQLAEAKDTARSYIEGAKLDALTRADMQKESRLLQSQLAEATRRLGEVEEVLRQIDAYHGPIRTPIHTITKLRGMARAALNKEPTK